MAHANVKSGFKSGNLIFEPKAPNTVGEVKFESVPVTITDGWLVLTDAAFGLSGAYRVSGLNAMPSRYELKWVAGARGKPALNADILNAAEATRMIADPDFELLGTNAVSTCSALNAEGGIAITTTAADNDQVIILPHLDASQTAWSTTTWGTDKDVVWECFIETAVITTMTIFAGLKLTNTSVTATDDDQAFFRYAAAVNDGKWQAIASSAGVDVAHDTAVTVAAATQYHLKIIVTSLIPYFYINSNLVATGAALVTAKDLIPYIGIHTNVAGARSLIVYGQAISRVAG